MSIDSHRVENTMKLIEVTSEQFAFLWLKMNPQQRMSVPELNAPNIDLASFGVNALVVVSGEIQTKRINPQKEITVNEIVRTAKEA